MNERDHTSMEELLAVRALDGLDGSDADDLRTLMDAHGDCPRCRELEADLADTAALLAMSLDPVQLDPRAADRIVAAAREETAPATVVPTEELSRRRSRRGLPVWLAAAAAFAVVVGSVATIRASGTTEVSTGWTQRVVHFQGAEGELAMAYVPGEPGVAFWGDHLPDPGSGHTYEIWMIDDQTPIPGGCVSPVDGRVAVFVDASVGTTDTMAVTVEPTSCPTEPTGEPVLRAQLS